MKCLLNQRPECPTFAEDVQFEIFLVKLFYAIMLAALNRASERFIDGFRYG